MEEAKSSHYIPDEDITIEIQTELAPGFGDLDVFATLAAMKKYKRPVTFEVGTGGSIGCQPLLHRGRIYFGACDHNFYCLDLKGKEVWRFGTNGPILFDFTIENNTIYFGSFDHNLYALTLDGDLLWKFGTGGMIGSKPTIANGIIYFGSRDKNLYALDARTGSLLWKYQTGDAICADPVVYRGRVYFGSWDKNIYCLDGRTGALIWRYTAKDTTASVLEYKGNLFFGSFDHYFRSITPTGKLRWEYKADGPVPGGVRYAAANGIVYFGSRDTHIYAVNSRTGKLVWRFPTGHMIISPPVYHKGVIYFSSGDSNLYAVDSKTGKQLWKRPFPLPVVSISVYNKILYIGCWDCNLYALSLKGKTIWKFHTSMSHPAPVNLEPEVQTIAEVIWEVPKREKDLKCYKDEVHLGDYGDFSPTYVDITKISYLGSKKKGYLAKPE